MTADPAEPYAGEPVTLTAQVEGDPTAGTDPTGTVEFFDGDTSLGSADLGSPATLTVDSLPAGEHQLTAHYGGDDVFNPARSEPLVISVAAALVETGAPPLGWLLGIALATLGTGGALLAVGARLRRRSQPPLNTT